MDTNNQVLNGRYRLGRLLGKGGFARVYLALDPNINGEVAVKILDSNPDPTENTKLFEQFEKEVRSVSSLGYHPNILAITDYGNAAGIPYLVMPFIQGGTLNEKLLHEGPLSPEQVGHYLQQIASALDFAHQRNLIHRDIKPQNILLQPNGDQVLLTDFGIAKVMGTDTTGYHTRTIGTIFYMAPEQFNGQVSPASDIYALGCMVFQMLTGQVPYQGTTGEIMGGHIMGRIPSVVEKSEGRVPLLVESVLNKALAKAPNERFRSAGEMYQAYREAITQPQQFDRGRLASTEVILNPVQPALQGYSVSYITQPQPPLPIPSYPSQPAPQKPNLALVVAGVVSLFAIIAAVLLVILLTRPVTPITSVSVFSTNTPAPTVPNTATSTTSVATQAPITTAQLPTITTVPPVTTSIVPATTAAIPTAPPTTATTSITVPAGYSRYQTRDLNFEIAYPATWKTNVTSDGLETGFLDGNGNGLYVRKTSSTATIPPETFNAGIRDSRLKEGWTITSQDSRHFGIAGEIWIQSAFQKKTDNGLFHQWVLVSLHDGIAYAVFLEGYENVFDGLLKEQFSRMLNNLRFLNTPLFEFANETKEYADSKQEFILNYPIGNWELDDQNRITGKTNKNALFYLRAATNSNRTISEDLDFLKEDLKNNVYTNSNFEETGRYNTVKLASGWLETRMRFTFTLNGTTYTGELAIRKQGQWLYAGVYRSNNVADLDTMYQLLWRYTLFLKQ